jgi:hypothetical protein
MKLDAETTLAAMRHTILATQPPGWVPYCEMVEWCKRHCTRDYYIHEQDDDGSETNFGFISRVDAEKFSSQHQCVVDAWEHDPVAYCAKWREKEQKMLEVLALPYLFFGEDLYDEDYDSSFIAGRYARYADWLSVADQLDALAIRFARPDLDVAKENNRAALELHAHYAHCSWNVEALHAQQEQDRRELEEWEERRHRDHREYEARLARGDVPTSPVHDLIAKLRSAAEARQAAG